MSEIPIDKILEKYSVSVPDRGVRRAAVSVIKEVIGVSIPFEAVSYQKGKIHVDTSPLLRSQIHIHKETILSKLVEQLEQVLIKDVR